MQTTCRVMYFFLSKKKKNGSELSRLLGFERRVFRSFFCPLTAARGGLPAEDISCQRRTAPRGRHDGRQGDRRKSGYHIIVLLLLFSRSYAPAVGRAGLRIRTAHDLDTLALQFVHVFHVRARHYHRFSSRYLHARVPSEGRHTRRVAEEEAMTTARPCENS